MWRQKQESSKIRIRSESIKGSRHTSWKDEER
jgi:hypothetical protein